MAQSESFDEIVDNFAFLDTWEERYGYVIDLGKAMPVLDEALRKAEYKVDGCASQVWLVPRLDGEGATRRLSFQGDSDAMIVRGLIAILTALASGKTVPQVADLDFRGELDRLELGQALSAQRSNGLNAMVERLKHIASHA